MCVLALYSINSCHPNCQYATHKRSIIITKACLLFSSPGINKTFAYLWCLSFALFSIQFDLTRYDIEKDITTMCLLFRCLVIISFSCCCYTRYMYVAVIVVVIAFLKSLTIKYANRVVWLLGWQMSQWVLLFNEFVVSFRSVIRFCICFSGFIRQHPFSLSLPACQHNNVCFYRFICSYVCMFNSFVIYNNLRALH